MTAWPKHRIGDVLKLERRQLEVDPLNEYEEIGVRSFGKGVFHKAPVTGAEIGSKRVFWIHPGDLVISNVFAWEGAIAVAGQDEVGRCGSHRFMTWVPSDPNKLDVAFVRDFLLSEPGLELVRRCSPGSAGRNRTLNIDLFNDVEIPLPALSEQQRIAGRLETFKFLSRTLSNAAATSDRLAGALLDSTRAWQFHKLRNTGTPELALRKVASVVMGQSPPGESYNDAGFGIPLLNGPTEFGRQHPQPRQWTTSPTRICSPGALLVSVRASIGRLNWADQPYCVGRGLAFLDPDTEVIESAFLRHAIAFVVGDLFRASAGSTFANLPGDKLREITVPVPDQQIQMRVSRLLDQIEQWRDLLTDAARGRTDVIRAIFPAVLSRAVGGSL